MIQLISVSEETVGTSIRRLPVVLEKDDIVVESIDVDVDIGDVSTVVVDDVVEDIDDCDDFEID